MDQNMSRQMQISLKKQILGNSVKQKIQQIIRITRKNCKTEYRGRTYAKNEVVLVPGWITDDFELRETKFHKIATTVTRDYDNGNIYTVPVGRYNQQTTFQKSKCEKKPKSALISRFRNS